MRFVANHHWSRNCKISARIDSLLAYKLLICVQCIHEWVVLPSTAAKLFCPLKQAVWLVQLTSSGTKGRSWSPKKSVASRGNCAGRLSMDMYRTPSAEKLWKSKSKMTFQRGYWAKAKSFHRYCQFPWSNCNARPGLTKTDAICQVQR